MNAVAADTPATQRPVPRTILADDHQIVLEAIRGVLGAAANVVATATTGRGLLAAVAEKAPDLVIADFEMPDGTGLDALKRLRAQGNETPFVILSMHAHSALVAASIRAGANAYVVKTAAGDELMTAIASVLEGKTYVSSALATAMRHSSVDFRYRLTPRQAQILELTALGLSTRKIGEQLGVSPRTIEAHKFNLMKLHDVNTSLELIHRAQELGLLL